MKLSVLLLLVAAHLVSCSKDSKDPWDSPGSGDCKGRYQNELFSSVKTTLNIQYGSAMNIAGAQESLFMDLYEPNNDTARQRAMMPPDKERCSFLFMAADGRVEPKHRGATSALSLRKEVTWSHPSITGSTSITL